MTDQWKFYVDALADVVLIFDLRFGQGGAAGDAPVNRFLAAINETLLDDVGKQPQLIGFIFLVQGEIRIVPIAQECPGV